MQQTVDKVLKIVVGFAVAGGALAAWHFMHINGGLAVLVGLAGLALIGHALDFC